MSLSNKLKFIGLDAQVIDNSVTNTTIVRMTGPTYLTTISSGSDPIFNISYDNNNVILYTIPNATITLTDPQSDERLITSDDNGQVNLSNLPSGIYQISINNSRSESLIMAKSDSQLEVVSVRYNNPLDYEIVVRGPPDTVVYINNTSIQGYIIYNGYGQITNSDGRLEPGTYRIYMIVDGIRVESSEFQANLQQYSAPEVIAYYSNPLTYAIYVDVPYERIARVMRADTGEVVWKSMLSASDGYEVLDYFSGIELQPGGYLADYVMEGDLYPSLSTYFTLP